MVCEKYANKVDMITVTVNIQTPCMPASFSQWSNSGVYHPYLVFLKLYFLVAISKQLSAATYLRSALSTTPGRDNASDFPCAVVLLPDQ